MQTPMQHTRKKSRIAEKIDELAQVRQKHQADADHNHHYYDTSKETEN